MSTYVSLLRYTQQGIADAKNGPARLDAAKEAFRRAGAELKAFYLIWASTTAWSSWRRRTTSPPPGWR